MDSPAKWTPAARRRLYLMRHGDVSYFDADGRPLRPDTVPLNEAGRLQSQAAARALSEAPLDRVMSSDLLRSVETAELVLAGRGLSVETRVQLREIQPGRLTDIPADGVQQAFLTAFDGHIDPDARFLGGESYRSLRDRVLTCLRELIADVRWKHQFIVAHGGVNRVILAHALDMGTQGFGSLEQDPGCINILDLDENGRWLVRLVNYTPYNPTKHGIVLTTMESLYMQYTSHP